MFSLLLSGALMSQIFAAFEMHGRLFEERGTDGILAAAHVHRVNAQCAQDIPCGHLAVVLVADIALAEVAADVGARQHFTDDFLGCGPDVPA